MCLAMRDDPNNGCQGDFISQLYITKVFLMSDLRKKKNDPSSPRRFIKNTMAPHLHESFQEFYNLS